MLLPCKQSSRAADTSILYNLRSQNSPHGEVETCSKCPGWLVACCQYGSSNGKLHASVYDHADDVSTSAPASAPHAKRAKHSAPVEIEELDADELLAYKRRLLDMLQAHETVLSALRRLGGLRQSGQASSGLSWKRARKSSGVSLIINALTKACTCSTSYKPICLCAIGHFEVLTMRKCIG